MAPDAAVAGEAFDPGDFGALQGHVKADSLPERVRTCWKNRWKWSQQASFANPVTGQRETWLMCVWEDLQHASCADATLGILVEICLR